MVFVADELEEAEVRRHALARNDEHALFARADGHVRPLLDDALFDDLSTLNETDPQNLRPAHLRHRSHHRGHLTGATTRYRTSRKRLLCHHPSPNEALTLRVASNLELTTGELQRFRPFP